MEHVIAYGLEIRGMGILNAAVYAGIGAKLATSLAITAYKRAR